MIQPVGQAAQRAAPAPAVTPWIGLVPHVVFALVWGSYFRVSKRVNNTFVN